MTTGKFSTEQKDLLYHKILRPKHRDWFQSSNEWLIGFLKKHIKSQTSFLWSAGHVPKAALKYTIENMKGQTRSLNNTYIH